MERWHNNPAMHIYHYAPYEPTTINRFLSNYFGVTACLSLKPFLTVCTKGCEEHVRLGVFAQEPAFGLALYGKDKGPLHGVLAVLSVVSRYLHPGKRMPVSHIATA